MEAILNGEIRGKRPMRDSVRKRCETLMPAGRAGTRPFGSAGMASPSAKTLRRLAVRNHKACSAQRVLRETMTNGAG